MNPATRWALAAVVIAVVSSALISSSSWWAILIVGALFCVYKAGAELRKGKA